MEKFAAKLGVQRCFVVRPPPQDPRPPKDANEALLRGYDLGELIESARPLAHQHILRAGNMKADVLAYVRGEEMASVRAPSLGKLNDICQGFRQGELVVLTGPTGAGKTTLLSQLSIDILMQGAPVLWGSFEIKTPRLLAKMLAQFNGEGELKFLAAERLDELYEDFEELPLSFMNFHGGTDMDKVMDAMEYAVYKDDVQHVFIDNLQFMMPRDPNKGRAPQNSSGFERFELQDRVIDRLRRFATEHNVCVFLVIHPRKEDHTRLPLGLSSFFGTAKATQEADMVMVLQQPSRERRDHKYVEVLKNRYNGELGQVHLSWSSSMQRYYPSSEEEIKERLKDGAKR